MMRWIIGSSLKARRVVLAAAVVVMAFGVFQLRDAKVDVLPEFAATDGVGQDRGPRALVGGGGAAHHDPVGAGSARGSGLGRQDPIRIGPRCLVHRDHLRAGNQPLPGAPSRAGTHQPGRRPAQRVTAAPDAAAHGLDQSHGDGLALVQETVSDPDRSACALDASTPPPRGAGRVQRGRVGPARAAAPGPGRPAEAARSTRHAAAGHPVDRATPCGSRR